MRVQNVDSGVLVLFVCVSVWGELGDPYFDTRQLLLLGQRSRLGQFYGEYLNAAFLASSVS